MRALNVGCFPAARKNPSAVGDRHPDGTLTPEAGSPFAAAGAAPRAWSHRTLSLPR
jgi:hypothetical protein